jgi:recombination protein RecA
MSFDLSSILGELSKEFGEGSITLATALKVREYRSSGSIAVDVALGGGWGKSTIVDVVGKQSAGKTLLFELAAVAAQRNENKPSCIFDYEGTFDPKRFIDLGGDPDGLAIIRAENFTDKVGPLFLEWAADMMKIQLRRQMFACICHDSTAAMVSESEYNIKEEKGEVAATMAYTARGMSSVLRQVVGTGLVARSGSTVFYLSQMRDNIGARGFKGMPPPDKRTGGRALPFYASTQIEVSRGDLFKADVETVGIVSKDTEVGHETKIRVRKNKNNAVQGRVTSFDIYSEGDVIGFDRVGELAQLAILTGAVIKRGNYYDVPGGVQMETVHGKDALTDYLRANDNAFAHVFKLTTHVLELTMESVPEETLGSVDPDEAMFAKLDAQNGN